MADHRNKIRRATQRERKEQMDGKDKLLWRHSALARDFHLMETGMLRLLKTHVFNNNTMESSMNGHTAVGQVRKTIRPKGVVYGWDYEHSDKRSPVDLGGSFTEDAPRPPVRGKKVSWCAVMDANAATLASPQRMRASNAGVRGCKRPDLDLGSGRAVPLRHHPPT
ncbi:axin-1 isoform X1 [Lates japonicus]|uniref:Axin-1 isoform X1 n=1 Tax=Lates japonicus TaxID=270547 RepID=A0AAD3QY94_LATJO|nr:axin-1 isoform X1 [Lates japonicus]